MVIDGEVFHLQWDRRDIVAVRRLQGRHRELAMTMLDDVQAEIEAIVRPRD